MMASRSIRGRLLGWLLATVAVAWVLAALATYADTHREVDRLLDAHLAQATAVLAAQAGHELLEIDSDDLLGLGEYGQEVTFQVWHGEDLLVRSRDAPGMRLGDGEGFTDSHVGGRDWRVFSIRDRIRGVLVEVAEDHAVRERIAARIAFNILVPLLVALPFLALVVWWAVSRAMRPLDGIGEQLRRRDPLALEPLDAGSAPAEVVPLVYRLNDLFGQIRRRTELERRFTADASHELRKPVAAARAQAEVARHCADPGARDGALDKVLAACDRMGALIDQMLTLARLEREGAARQAVPVDLGAVVREIIAEAAPAAMQETGIQIGLATTGSTAVVGHADLLGILARNLITNAVRHGGTEVAVRVVGLSGEVSLSVTDSGPGVPAEDLDRLGERFFRGAATGPGSGLGLSIVRRIADMHAATMEFRHGPSGRGLEARVRFAAGGAAGRA
jgi:two-component system sensor histidine kinase QseC